MNADNGLETTLTSPNNLDKTTTEPVQFKYILKIN